MNNEITKQKLLENPLIAYAISIPKPEVLKLSEYETTAFPAIIGNLLNTSILKVEPKYKIGRVLSFDVEPRNRVDPIIIYSTVGNLKPYYKIYREVINSGMRWNKNRKINSYDNSIKEFIESSERLDIHELVFAVIEMLKFKNDIILNESIW